MPKKPRNPYELQTLVDEYLNHYQLDILPRYLRKYLKPEYKSLVVKHTGWRYFLVDNFEDYPPILIMEKPGKFCRPILLS